MTERKIGKSKIWFQHGGVPVNFTHCVANNLDTVNCDSCIVSAERERRLVTEIT